MKFLTLAVLVILPILNIASASEISETNGTESTGADLKEPAACTLLCIKGTKCVLTTCKTTTSNTTCVNKASCEPIKEAADPVPIYSEITTTEAFVAPTCETVYCPKGFICVLKQVECIRAPCPPIPDCVSIPKGRPRITCANIRCAGICVMERKCPFCPILPTCKPRF